MPNEAPKSKILSYRRSHFVTRLPVDFLYSPSHCWLQRCNDEGLWRVGITKFASRMLGEMVDFGFELKPADPAKTGQIIGWLEGFKAISDVYCVVEGAFADSNPALEKKIGFIDKDPYQKGWLYDATGEPDPKCMNVDDYVAVLDKTIDKILENQSADEIN